MQPEQLKSLVETGHYRPEPALVAEAMLRRRGVRELLTAEPQPLNPAGRSRRLQKSGPPGSLISTPSPATTSPIRRQRDPARSTARRVRRAARRAAPPAARSPRRRRPPAAAGRGPAAAAISATPSASGSASASIRSPTPLASARWPASPPSPSLRSIIAVAPARGQRPAGRQPRLRLELAARAAARRSPREPRTRSSRRSSSSRPAAAPPISPVSTRASPGWAPAPGDEAARRVGAGRRRSPRG